MEVEKNAELEEARERLSACVLSNAWTFTLPAMVPAVWYGVRKTTYWPLVGVSVFGSAADFYSAHIICAGLRERAEQLDFATAGGERQAGT
jgi:hypothetical protein